MSVNASKDLSDQFLTPLAKLVVDLTALDEEHVHPDLEWHLVSDALDHHMIPIDLSLELITVVWLLLQELIDALLLGKEEQEVIVDVESFLDYLQVLRDCFRDLGLGIVYNLVVGWNIPEVLFVAALNSVLRSRQVPALKHNVVNNDFELVLNLGERHLELDLVLGLVDVKLDSDEVVFIWGVSVIFPLDDLARSWILWLLEPLNEINVLVKGLLDEFTNLVGHQSRS